MMELSVDWPGYLSLDQKLKTIVELDALPLMERWADIIIEGNRRGVLSGVDGLDNPMPALKYRDTGKIKKVRNRRVGELPAGYGETRYQPSGFGPYITGLHDNLTTKQYQELDGPRLAPRWERSRAIKNLHTEIQHPDATTWIVVGAWDVHSVKGVKFLPYHFEGAGNLPQYDLRPVRPQDLQFCINEMNAFMNIFFRERF